MNIKQSILFAGRYKNPKSYLYQDNLPLDMFKLIHNYTFDGTCDKCELQIYSSPTTYCKHYNVICEDCLNELNKSKCKDCEDEISKRKEKINRCLGCYIFFGLIIGFPLCITGAILTAQYSINDNGKNKGGYSLLLAFGYGCIGFTLLIASSYIIEFFYKKCNKF
jgi:hypothetical protein